MANQSVSRTRPVRIQDLSNVPGLFSKDFSPYAFWNGSTRPQTVSGCLLRSGDGRQFARAFLPGDPGARDDLSTPPSTQSDRFRLGDASAVKTAKGSVVPPSIEAPPDQFRDASDK